VRVLGHAQWNLSHVHGLIDDVFKFLVADRNASQKHVWRAEIVLLTAEGLGTNEIMRRTASKDLCLAMARALHGGRF